MKRVASLRLGSVGLCSLPLFTSPPELHISRISQRSPMAEEAEVASVVSLIQGMYIDNVSMTII